MRWVFDPISTSGADSGSDSGEGAGEDPAAFVFDARLETFVREVLQNSLDARLPEEEGGGRVDVRLVVEPLDEGRAAAMRSALGWSALRTHIEAVAREADTPVARRFLRAVGPEPGPPILLWVEDRGTTGLDGPESGQGRFAALCRDRLSGDGGKDVLWRFSRWSVVVLGSRPAVRSLEGAHRLIVRAVLPRHALGRETFSGEGWLGRPQPAAGGGHRAESVWDIEATRVLEALGSEPLPAGTSGTRIGVFGFEDPSRSAPLPPGELAIELATAAEHEFWPAIARGRLGVEVFAAGRRALPRASGAPWRRMLEIYDARGEAASLSGPGEVVVREVPFALPRQRGGRGPVEASVDLVVRAAEEGEAALYEVISLGGSGRVISRADERGLAPQVRPFQAMVIAGGARRSAGRTDALVDALLREASPRSRERWRRVERPAAAGAARALGALMDRVRDALRAVASVPVEAGDEGPVGLLALFPRPDPRGAAPLGSAFRLSSLSARLEGGRWRFSGVVAPAAAVAGAWTVRLDARCLGVDGAAARRMIGELRASPGSGRLEDGLAIIEAPPNTASVRFEGRTDPARHPTDVRHTALELVLCGAGGTASPTPTHRPDSV